MVNSDAVNYEVSAPDKSFFNAKLWDKKGEKAFAFENGVNIKVGANNQAYKYEGLINFDMIIDETNPTGGWPSFAMSTDGNDYSNGDMYFIGFDDEYIELQRFNKGQRTVIMGKVDGFEAEVGRGINVDGLFEYGKRHNITMGIVTKEDGVHVILNIDGKSAFDYVDNSDKKLTGGFFPYVYARSSTFSILPASNN